MPPSNSGRRGLFPRPAGFSLDPPTVPDARKAENEPIHTAYCPLAEKLCSNVECEKCGILEETFPEGFWVCTECAQGLQTVPYYGNTSCALCGDDYGALSLAVPDE